MRSAAGRSLLEFCLSVALTMPIMVLLARSVSTSSGTVATATKWGGRVYRSLLVQGYLERALSDLDEHRIPLLPRVSSGSALLLSDGSPVSLPARLPGSSTFTWARLAPARRRRVAVPSDGATLHLCLEDPGSKALDEERKLQFVGLSPRGVVELAGLATTPDGPGCETLTATVVPSTLFDSATSVTLTEIQRVVPIVSISTLMVDKSGTLRFLGHRGSATTENQPLESGFAAFTVQGREMPETSTFEITALVQMKGDRPRTLRLYNRLPRTDLPTLLFNDLF